MIKDPLRQPFPVLYTLSLRHTGRVAHISPLFGNHCATPFTYTNSLSVSLSLSLSISSIMDITPAEALERENDTLGGLTFTQTTPTHRRYRGLSGHTFHMNSSAVLRQFDMRKSPSMQISGAARSLNERERERKEKKSVKKASTLTAFIKQATISATRATDKCSLSVYCDNV